MIGFSAPTYDIDGALIVMEDRAKTQLDPPPARVSRSKCLDGSVYIGHYGVVDGDRTFKIVIRSATSTEYEFLKRLHASYTSAIVSCREGVFSGALESINMSGGNLTVKYLVSERLDT